MVPYQRLIEATESWWHWIVQCWRLREVVRYVATGGHVEELQKELRDARDKNHLLKIELDAVKAALGKETEALKLSRGGNMALLRFIHTGHRMNVKFDPDSIRAALQQTATK